MSTTLTNMKLTTEEAKQDSGLCSPSDPGDLPAYPYGLLLSLNDETMKKLAMSLPEIGTKFALSAMVEVTMASARADQDGKEIRTELQITDMALTPETKDVQLSYSSMKE